MSNKSNVDVALDIVSKSTAPVAFKDLWVRICVEQDIPADAAAKKIGDFYTSLLLDGRFVNLGDNTWDLRSRYTFDKVTLDTSECYSEDAEEDETGSDLDEDEKKELAEEKGEEASDDEDEEKSEFEEE